MRISPRIVVQVGGVGGGRLECDSEKHYWIVPDESLGTPLRTPVGPCWDFAACKQAAELLEKQAAEEEEAKAKG